MSEHVNIPGLSKPEIYSQEHEKAINDGVAKLMSLLKTEIPVIEKQIIDQSPNLNCDEGINFVNFTVNYNLVLELLTSYLNLVDKDMKDGIRSMLESDLCEVIDGPMTAEEIALAEKQLGGTVLA